MAWPWYMLSPLGEKYQFAIEHGHFFCWFSYWNWWCSIVILVCPRVFILNIVHGSIETSTATQDGDWDTDDLERLVFEMPDTQHQLPGDSVQKTRRPVGQWLCSRHGGQLCTEAEAGKCPKRIGMARATRLSGDVGIQLMLRCYGMLVGCGGQISIYAMSHHNLRRHLTLQEMWWTKMLSIRSKALELYTWSKLEQQQHHCRIKIVHVYCWNAATQYQTSFNSSTFVHFT